MHKVNCLLLLLCFAMTPYSSLASEYNESTQYLGVINGQVQGNNVVKVTRTLSKPEIFKSDDVDNLPHYLLIRNADIRNASDGMSHITVRQPITGGGSDASVTLKTALVVDGQRVSIFPEKRGEDVYITIPKATKQVALRTDSPIELELPANYRGNIKVEVQIEGGIID